MKVGIIEYKYLKVLDKVMTSASIVLEISPNTLEKDQIYIDTEKIPFRSQGMIEGGHKNWNISAKKALESALKHTQKSTNLNITIKKLEGRIFLDTNNASIGIACILALWKYLTIQPKNSTMTIIHRFVKEDWNNEVDQIPNFELIFGN